MTGVQTCARSEEHTSELQSHDNLVCRLLLEKKRTLHTLPPHPTRTRSLRAAHPAPTRPAPQRSTTPPPQPSRLPHSPRPHFLFFFKGSGPPQNLPFSPPPPSPV